MYVDGCTDISSVIIWTLFRHVLLSVFWKPCTAIWFIAGFVPVNLHKSLPFFRSTYSVLAWCSFCLVHLTDCSLYIFVHHCPYVDHLVTNPASILTCPKCWAQCTHHVILLYVVLPHWPNPMTKSFHLGRLGDIQCRFNILLIVGFQWKDDKNSSEK